MGLLLAIAVMTLRRIIAPWTNVSRTMPLDKMVEYAHRRHWVEQCHQDAKGLLGWDQYQKRLQPESHSFLVWQEFPQR
jgi:hypothetical protein